MITSKNCVCFSKHIHLVRVSVCVCVSLYFNQCFVFSPKIFIYFSLERGERKEKGREASMCGCLYWGPGLQPSHVPWLGIKWATLWSAAHAQSTELHQSGLLQSVSSCEGLRRKGKVSIGSGLMINIIHLLCRKPFKRIVLRDLWHHEWISGKEVFPTGPRRRCVQRACFLTAGHQRPCYGDRVCFSLVIFWVIILRKPKCL